MCYEYDDLNWLEAARAAEQLRKNKEKVDKQKKTAPVQPAEPGKRVKEKESVPA